LFLPNQYCPIIVWKIELGMMVFCVTPCMVGTVVDISWSNFYYFEVCKFNSCVCMQNWIFIMTMVLSHNHINSVSYQHVEEFKCLNLLWCGRFDNSEIHFVAFLCTDSMLWHLSVGMPSIPGYLWCLINCHKRICSWFYSQCCNSYVVSYTVHIIFLFAHTLLTLLQVSLVLECSYMYCHIKGRAGIFQVG